MNLNLADTLEYNGIELEYADTYFVRGMMNKGIRVYESDDGSIAVHFNPETGLARLVGPEGKSTRVEAADEPGPGPVSLSERR